MARRVRIKTDWLNDASDPAEVANAKITLSIMRLVQGMSKQMRFWDSMSLGELFGPAFLQCPRELHLACGKLLQATLEYTDEELAESLIGLDEDDEAEDDYLFKVGQPCAKILRFDEPNIPDSFEYADEKTQALLARMESKKREIARRLFSEMGHDWIIEILRKPTYASRRLFAASQRVLRDFADQGDAISCESKGNNLQLISDALGLNQAEIRHLELADAIQQATVDTTVLLESVVRPQEIREGLALIYGSNIRDSKNILEPRGRLQSSGIFADIHSHDVSLGQLFRLTTFGEYLTRQPFQTMEEMASAILKPLQTQGTRKLEWPHLVTETNFLFSALSSALADKMEGINILFHGAPGTGKTEFARHLCAELECSAYSIATIDDSGNEAHRGARISSLHLCQRLAGKSGQAVLVLDEAEDIFQSNYSGFFGQMFSQGRVEGKGWTNQLLETNKHPVIWICNSIDQIEPAYLRRFSYVMEFRVPPRAQRLAVAQHHLAPVGASTDLLQRLSRNPDLTPAMLASAAKFASLVQCAQPGMTTDRLVEHHITKQCHAFGLTEAGAVPDLVTRFDTRYLNVKGKASAEQITVALARTLRGSAVFAGPPGTGKTQLAAHIAERSNRELLYRTAADINSMWFGQSEKNVAELFEDCNVDQQMIFLDEADTLLMDRGSDVNRPERAVTAEFLRRLEAFKGIFVCATNHSNVFDAALMRRFVFRLAFAPMTLPQRALMFAETVLSMPIIDCDAGDLTSTLPRDVVHGLVKLDRLTPGDFANVKKRFATLGCEATAEQWLVELQEEQSAKGLSPCRGMGFMD